MSVCSAVAQQAILFGVLLGCRLHRRAPPPRSARPTRAPAPRDGGALHARQPPRGVPPPPPRVWMGTPCVGRGGGCSAAAAATAAAGRPGVASEPLGDARRPRACAARPPAVGVRSVGEQAGVGRGGDGRDLAVALVWAVREGRPRGAHARRPDGWRPRLTRGGKGPVGTGPARAPGRTPRRLGESIHLASGGGGRVPVGALAPVAARDPQQRKDGVAIRGPQAVGEPHGDASDVVEQRTRQRLAGVRGRDAPRPGAAHDKGDRSDGRAVGVHAQDTARARR